MIILLLPPIFTFLIIVIIVSIIYSRTDSSPRLIFNLYKDKHDIFKTNIRIDNTMVSLAIDTGSSHIAYASEEIVHGNKDTLVYGTQRVNVNWRKTSVLQDYMRVGVFSKSDHPYAYNILGLNLGKGFLKNVRSFSISQFQLVLNDYAPRHAVKVPRIFGKAPDSLFVVEGIVDGVKAVPCVIDTGSNNFAIGYNINTPKNLSIGGIDVLLNYVDKADTPSNNFIDDCIVVPSSILYENVVFFTKNFIYLLNKKTTT